MLTFALVDLIASAAHAAIGGGGGGLPWSTPLQNLRADMTGPTATVLALVGFVLVMGILIFGGELNHFGRSLCFLILTASVLVGANNFLTGIGVAGATLDTEDGFNAFVSGAIAASLFWGMGLWVRHRRVARQKRTNERLGLASVPLAR